MKHKYQCHIFIIIKLLEMITHGLQIQPKKLSLRLEGKRRRKKKKDLYIRGKTGLKELGNSSTTKIYV